ncbi:U3 small nucleolar RNA-interacting protein 2-like [Dysidea avara]|uniref:U3 small nucleolar RNA-interacting protein 2-like n=1 Tax=Dysidea avara TaxID=196820 RepID=UPI003318FC53
MSSFFLPSKPPKGDRKRKRTQLNKKKNATKQKKSTKLTNENEEIASDSEIEEDQVAMVKDKKLRHDDNDSSSEEETAQEKRVRLAKEYIAELEEQEKLKLDQSSIDHDAIAHRLKEDALRQSGRLLRKVADTYVKPASDNIRILKGHRLPLTCAVVANDSQFIYSGSKDCSIIKWNVTSGKKEGVISGYFKYTEKPAESTSFPTGQVLALAVSTDGKYLVSGGEDKMVRVWEADTLTHVKNFKGHRNAVTGLTFQQGSYELFSCSSDRTVKIWNLDEMVYVETLFGHHDEVTAVDCLMRERPVSSGGNDRSVRLWKVIEETQLVFQGHKSAIDCIKLINEEHILSGSQDGSIAVWNVQKKKPLVTTSHSSEDTPPTGAGELWVTAIATLPYTDLIASGSSDGFVRLWKCGEKFKHLQYLFSIPVRGTVNGLCFSHCGKFLVAAVGWEHRLGRWWSDKTAKNVIVLISLDRNSSEQLTK